MSTNQQDYQKLIAKMNQQMLVTDDDRVPLLQQILAKLGHPDHAYKIIHIAGTNGKGSTGHAGGCSAKEWLSHWPFF